jgi:hypothetical protein
MPVGVWYASREDLKSALDVMETARSDRQVDRALESATRSVEGDLHRLFYPETATRTFDWPNYQYAAPWRLWLGRHELVSVDTLTIAGAAVDADDFLLRPDDGPPFTHIELVLSSSASFGGGSTHQRAVSIVGVFAGCRLDEVPAGALAEALDVSETAVDVSDGSVMGVGHVLRVDDERMVVTGRAVLDSGQNLGGNLAALASDVTVAVSDGTEFAAGEVLLVDAERMRVVEVAGNNLVVRRATDGTVLAAHTSGADVFVSRRLTVTRGALGTTAATHEDAAPLLRWLPPGPVSTYTLALGINTILQERAGYARTVGSAENQHEAAGRGLRSARAEAWKRYGRKARMGAV